MPRSAVLEMLQELVDIVGDEDTARAVMGAFEERTFPAVKSLELAETEREARAMYEEGQPLGEIARALDVSRSTVYHWRRGWSRVRRRRK
jgi:transposase-like protein